MEQYEDEQELYVERPHERRDELETGNFMRGDPKRDPANAQVTKPRGESRSANTETLTLATSRTPYETRTF